MAYHPWVSPERHDQAIDEIPRPQCWRANIEARPAVQRAYDTVKTVNVQPTVFDEVSRKILFGQDQTAVK